MADQYSHPQAMLNQEPRQQFPDFKVTEYSDGIARIIHYY